MPPEYQWLLQKEDKSIAMFSERVPLKLPNLTHLLQGGPERQTAVQPGQTDRHVGQPMHDVSRTQVIL